MKLTINPPLSLHNIGKRANNEDNVFPPKGTATVENNLFIIADGIGGLHNGEVASRVVCEAFSEFLQQAFDGFDAEMFQQALEYAYYQSYASDTEDEPRKMGTTLALLRLHSGGAFMAHIGDSRIYHLRPDGRGDCTILYRSQDQSFVAELLAAGVISEKEARQHPQRNVLTRAIITRTIQPCQSRVDADIKETADVQPGDYFFLCSDGVLESIDDYALCKIMGATDTDAEKMRKIERICIENSNDNFSAYLISIAAVEA